MAYFELRTPRDMLEKAERELDRLQRDMTVDNIFNFFVTAYHIQDYVRGTNSVPIPALHAFLADPDLKDCRALCHKGKHLHLSGHPEALTGRASGSFSDHSFSEVSFSAGTVRTLYYGGRAVDVHSLPKRVVAKWRQFLGEHAL